MDETVGMVMEKVEGIKGTVGEIKEKVLFFQNETKERFFCIKESQKTT